MLYVKQSSKKIVPVIFLDSCRAHMISNFFVATKSLGLDVFHLPGGCTCLCQQVDNGCCQNATKLLWQRMTNPISHNAIYLSE
jgi:hypothetical protein